MAPKRRNKRESAWTQRFKELRQWLAAHDGEYPLRAAEDAKGKRLARWVNTMRTNQSKGKRLDARTNQLEGLQGWRWSRRTAREIRAWPQGALAHASAQVAPMDLD